MSGLFFCSHCAAVLQLPRASSEAQCEAALRALLPTSTTSSTTSSLCCVCLGLQHFLRSSSALTSLRSLLSAASLRSCPTLLLLCPALLLRAALAVNAAPPNALEESLRNAAYAALNTCCDNVINNNNNNNNNVDNNWGSSAVVTLLHLGCSGDAAFLSLQGDAAPAKKKRSRGARGSATAAAADELSKAALTKYLDRHSVTQLAADVLRAAQLRKADVVLTAPTFSLVGPQRWVGGRYRKLARNVPQSEWHAGGARIGSASVEERIAAKVLALTGGTATLGAAGREDRDVRMMGEGRPFYLNIKDMRCDTITNEQLVSIKFDASSDGIEVFDLRWMTKDEAAAVDAGAQQKVKCYKAVVRVDRAVVDAEDLHRRLRELPSDLLLQQLTPIRVVHRRSRLVRPRGIRNLKCVPLPTDARLFTLEMETDAGLYVKEFVHGDMGRTQPSLSGLLGLPCTILALDVTRVRLDALGGENEAAEDDDEEDDNKEEEQQEDDNDDD